MIVEPKFQSSFIPKGPAATASMTPSRSLTRKGGIFNFISLAIFIISLVLAIAVFGYKYYVQASINRMGQEIEASSGDLVPSAGRDFIRLNNRLISTESLLNRHVVISPLFDFLETATLKSVRFNDFLYNTNSGGVELLIKGQARGYADVALQSDVFNKSPYFENPVFSDLSLDERGNVTFTLRATINPELISYKKLLENEVVVPAPVTIESAVTTPASTTTATTSTSN